MLALPFLCRDRESGTLGVALSEKLLQVGDNTRLVFVVLWDGDHRSPQLADSEQIEWLSVPSVTDLDDSPLEDLLFESEVEDEDEDSSEYDDGEYGDENSDSLPESVDVIPES